MEVPGHCHCGELHWSTHLPSGSLPEKTICHCGACKSFGGGEYSVSMVVPKEQVRLTKGAPKVYTYIGQSGNPVECYYCPNCTSHAFHHQTILGDNLTMRPMLWENKTAQDSPVDREVFGKNRCAFQPVIARGGNVMES